MTLTLRIDNYDVLADGGPTSITVEGKSIAVGRSSTNDWSLPDPERHISSHHFDVEFRDGGYWLKDTSTNGVFLDGQRHRLDGAHQLRDGDRFQVGHYYITVSLAGAAPAPTGFTPTTSSSSAPAAAPAAPAADADPWSMGGPVDPIDPNPPAPASDPFADFTGEFIVNPSAVAAPPPAQPAAPMAPPASSSSPFGGPSPAAAPTPAGMTPPAPQFMPAAAPAAPVAAAGGGAEALIRAFCEGAGLIPDAYLSNDATALARELGRTMQASAVELMTMLQDRASAKKFTKGGDRTMMGNTENNPLKFLPDAAQALEVMFLAPRPGFMEGGKGVNEALKDVRTHQMAIFAAIQPALIALLSDISPEAIEADAGGGVLGGGKRKSWDTFVERWDAKVGNHENGMLDAFLKHFAEAYVDAVSKARR